MNILPYKLSTTNDQLTSRAGLLTVALMMEQLSLSKHLDRAFPEPKSNRAIGASSYIETLILMQHQGLFHLDDVKETLIKSNYFKLAKTADIFHEDRCNRMTITSHFMKNSDRFFCA